jgi:hypothetical protein
MICLYLVTELSCLLIIKRVINPAASSAAGFFIAATHLAVHNPAMPLRNAVAESGTSIGGASL